jgi:hypothetical protein
VLENAYGLGVSGLAHIPATPERLPLIDPRVLAAVQTTLDQAYEAAKTLVSVNRDALEALASALLERGYLDAAEIEGVLRRTPLVRTVAAAEMSAAIQSPTPNASIQEDGIKTAEFDIAAADAPVILNHRREAMTMQNE